MLQLNFKVCKDLWEKKESVITGNRMSKPAAEKSRSFRKWQRNGLVRLRIYVKMKTEWERRKQVILVLAQLQDEKGKKQNKIKQK